MGENHEITNRADRNCPQVSKIASELLYLFKRPRYARIKMSWENNNNTSLAAPCVEEIIQPEKNPRGRYLGCKISMVETWKMCVVDEAMQKTVFPRFHAGGLQSSV